MRHNAIAILSGGLDSATAMQLAIEQGLYVSGAVWFYYGQRHSFESSFAQDIAAHYKVQIEHLVIPSGIFASNQLSDPEQSPRLGTPIEEITKGVAPTFVPGRNMVMLALAASFAVAHECDSVVGGWHWDDSSGLAN